MKTVRYFWTEAGKLRQLNESDKLIQDVNWYKNETLKVEIWPFDLKIGPSTQIPYGKQKKKDRVQELTELMDEYRAKRREKETWPNQEALIRVDKARTPYSEEFTKRDDARNRAYLSTKVSKRRKYSKRPPPQTDAPF